MCLMILCRQLTVQELSPMIRLGLKPIIFVLNNKGYTIERFIHGKKRLVNIFIAYLCLTSHNQEIQRHPQLELD